MFKTVKEYKTYLKDRIKEGGRPSIYLNMRNASIEDGRSIESKPFNRAFSKSVRENGEEAIDIIDELYPNLLEYSMNRTNEVAKNY